MTAPARRIPAAITVDRFTTSSKLAEFALFEHQLEGSKPYVRVVQVDAPCAALDLLPNDATVERCVTTDSSVSVLAWLEDACVLIETWPRSTTIRVAASSHDRSEWVASTLRSRLPEPAINSVPVRIWHHSCSSSGVREDRNIEAPHWRDISRNYPPTARASVEALTALNRPAGKGKLILWHGPPGTGKTTALRALMRSWSPWCQPQYIADPEKFFSEPAYMTEVLTTPPTAAAGPSLSSAGQPEAMWRLIVAEDSDEYLRATARRDAGAALGRLLNLADGILGQGMNVLFLLTTNEETSRLHPALVRPGRCLAAIQFPQFEEQQAARWAGRPVGRSMTLAELLELRGDLARLGDNDHNHDGIGQYL